MRLARPWRTPVPMPPAGHHLEAILPFSVACHGARANTGQALTLSAHRPGWPARRDWRRGRHLPLASHPRRGRRHPRPAPHPRREHPPRGSRPAPLHLWPGGRRSLAARQRPCNRRQPALQRAAKAGWLRQSRPRQTISAQCFSLGAKDASGSADLGRAGAGRFRHDARPVTRHAAIHHRRNGMKRASHCAATHHRRQRLIIGGLAGGRQRGRPAMNRRRGPR